MTTFLHQWEKNVRVHYVAVRDFVLFSTAETLPGSPSVGAQSPSDDFLMQSFTANRQNLSFRQRLIRFVFLSDVRRCTPLLTLHDIVLFGQVVKMWRNTIWGQLVGSPLSVCRSCLKWRAKMGTAGINRSIILGFILCYPTFFETTRRVQNTGEARWCINMRCFLRTTTKCALANKQTLLSNIFCAYKCC